MCYCELRVGWWEIRKGTAMVPFIPEFQQPRTVRLARPGLQLAWDPDGLSSSPSHIYCGSIRDGVIPGQTRTALVRAIPLFGYAWSLGYKDPLDPLPPPQLWHHIAQSSLASSTGGRLPDVTSWICT